MHAMEGQALPECPALGSTHLLSSLCWQGMPSPEYTSCSRPVGSTSSGLPLRSVLPFRFCHSSLPPRLWKPGGQKPQLTWCPQQAQHLAWGTECSEWFVG